MRAIAVSLLSLMSLTALAQTQPLMNPTPALDARPQDQVVRPEWRPSAGPTEAPAFTTSRKSFGSSLGGDASSHQGNATNLGRYDGLGIGVPAPADADARCKAQQAGGNVRFPVDADPCRR